MTEPAEDFPPTEAEKLFIQALEKVWDQAAVEKLEIVEIEGELFARQPDGTFLPCIVDKFSKP